MNHRGYSVDNEEKLQGPQTRVDQNESFTCRLQMCKVVGLFAVEQIKKRIDVIR